MVKIEEEISKHRLRLAELTNIRWYCKKNKVPFTHNRELQGLWVKLSLAEGNLLGQRWNINIMGEGGERL